MKANRKRRAEKNDTAEVGIGTMIVFIAAVIVAAIAAAVLVNTAGDLQRKSQETGSETTQEVSGNMFVRDIVAHNDDSGTDEKIDHVVWYLSLAPGADPIDLNSTVLRYQAEMNNTELTQDQGDVSCSTTNLKNLGDGFCVETVRQDSNDANKFLLSEGDRVRIEVFLSDDQSGNEEDVATREEVNALFLPSAGSQTDASFTTPPTFEEEFKSVA